MSLLITDYQAPAIAGTRRAAKGIERRRGLRIRQARPVNIFQSTAAKYVTGQTEDISTTGLRLELPAGSPLAEGDLLNVHIGARGSARPLANFRQMMPARVIWIDHTDSFKTGHLTAGIEFITSIAAHLDAA